MAIQLASNIVQRNGNTWPLMDDSALAGGFRVVADLAARDAINPQCLKVGAQIRVITENKTYHVTAIDQGVATFAELGLAAHTHEISEVNGLSAALASAASSGPTLKTVNGNALEGTGNVAVGDVTLTGVQTLTQKELTRPKIVGPIEQRVALATGVNIDLAAGTVFTKTITGATTFTVSNVPTAGNVGSFILELTNGGAFAVTWWAGVKTTGGVVHTFTTSGTDILGFYTHDAGVTWRCLLLSVDSK